MEPDELARYRDATREAWNRNAQYWDERMATANDWHAVLVRPATEHLLALRAGEVVLDIGAGNGLFSRRLGDLGARVVAIDASDRLIERARTRNGHERVDYRVIDATDEEALLGLGDRSFDAAVSTMALMDMPVLDPLAGALSRLLKPGGRFVFAIAHPCFNTGAVSLEAEQAHDAEMRLDRAVKVYRYLGLRPERGVALSGQPTLQYYFDRPLHELLRPFFTAGLVLNALEEPAFPPGRDGGSLSWENYPEIPPVLVGRLLSP